MASFYGHFSTAVVCGAAYGGLGAWYGHYDWGIVFLAGGLTVLGGLAPDLDSDSGRPIRELFGVFGAIIPLFLLPRLRRHGFTIEQMLTVLIGAYLFIRYGLSEILKKMSVHRGMFHSVPALLISGLAVYGLYHNDNEFFRFYLAGGIMLGFFSHLLLDEFCSVDLSGVPRVKNSFGTAIKLFSSSWGANLVCYAILALLGWHAWKDHNEPPGQENSGRTIIRPGMYQSKKW